MMRRKTREEALDEFNDALVDFIDTSAPLLDKLKTTWMHSQKRAGKDNAIYTVLVIKVDPRFETLPKK